MMLRRMVLSLLVRGVVMVCGRVSRVARWCVAVVVVAVVCAGVWCGVASRRRAAGRAAVQRGLDLVVADGGRRFDFVYRGVWGWVSLSGVCFVGWGSSGGGVVGGRVWVA